MPLHVILYCLCQDNGDALVCLLCQLLEVVPCFAVDLGTDLYGMHYDPYMMSHVMSRYSMISGDASDLSLDKHGLIHCYDTTSTINAESAGRISNFHPITP